MPHVTRMSLQAPAGLDDTGFEELRTTVHAALLCRENRIGLVGPTIGGGLFEEWVAASLEKWAGEMYWAGKKPVWRYGGGGDRKEIQEVFHDLVVYIAGRAYNTRKAREVSPSWEYSPVVNVPDGGNHVIEGNRACVPTQPGKCVGLEFPIPYTPTPNEFPRFQQEATPSSTVQGSKHRYPTRRRSTPSHVKLSEMIPKPGPRRRRNWSTLKKKVMKVSEPTVTPLNRAPLDLAPPPIPPPIPQLAQHSETPSPQSKPPQYPKTYSSHPVFVTRLADKTPVQPGLTLGFLQKVRQKWSLPEVKEVRVEADEQVFEVDLEEERD
ncbi:hypothetical protein HOY80DRAFT_1012058 [Tuber brumale]|nr:hypothetical protein HOY80DRAFT_1012058 [Tuber brumale]